jgi:uncharacterized membrane protein
MPLAGNFFSEEEQDHIVKAITEAELKTSGEIRVHIENLCIGNEIKRAEAVFLKLNMHLTKEKNGILIYIATMSRKIAVVGDQGIHQKLGDVFWKNLVDGLIRNFKTDRKAASLSESILKCGEELGKFFPRKDDDVDELSNSISFN